MLAVPAISPERGPKKFPMREISEYGTVTSTVSTGSSTSACVMVIVKDKPVGAITWFTRVVTAAYGAEDD